MSLVALLGLLAGAGLLAVMVWMLAEAIGISPSKWTDDPVTSRIVLYWLASVAAFFVASSHFDKYTIGQNRSSPHWLSATAAVFPLLLSGYSLHDGRLPDTLWRWIAGAFIVVAAGIQAINIGWRRSA